MHFYDRADAGRKLAEQLIDLRESDGLILALPRGGVPVAKQVADRLHLPMTVLVVRKIGAPFNPEYAIGALSEDGEPILDEETIAMTGTTPDQLKAIVVEENTEMKRRIQLYRHGKSLPPIAGKKVVVVDDGLATGMTARAAIRYLKKQGAKHIIVAVPVGSADACSMLRHEGVEVRCLSTPAGFSAVGQWYQVFNQTSDGEVLELLDS